VLSNQLETIRRGAELLAANARAAAEASPAEAAQIVGQMWTDSKRLWDQAREALRLANIAVDDEVPA